MNYAVALLLSQAAACAAIACLVVAALGLVLVERAAALLGWAS